MTKYIFPLAALVTAMLIIFALIGKQQEPREAPAPVPIGGAFTLTDQHNSIVKDSDFRGRVMLVFFGFTHCPDICPVTSKTLAEVMKKLGGKAGQVAPIFITVDPARDTPKVIGEYLANFDTRIIGLTGSDQQIKQVTDAYKAYYAKNASKKTSHNPHEAHHGGDYQVDHSGYIYLMDRNGAYLAHFPYDASPATILDALQPLLK